MRKRNLEIYQAALELADSGNAQNWKAIQDRLVEMGYRRAPNLLDNQEIKTLLDLRCAESRKSA